MDFNEYQIESKKTALYPEFGARYVYPALGLVNEAGEVAGKVKKAIRDDNGLITDERRQNIKEEMGDVLWYLSQLATELDISLEEIAKVNIAKLRSRAERNALRGDGDNR